MNTWVSGKVFNPPQEKTKRRFPKFLKIFFLILILAGILGYIFFYSSFFQIKKVVADNPALTEEFLNQYRGQNIILLSTKKVQQEVTQKLPYIENIKVIRGLPDTLRIETKTYQPELIWQTQNHQYSVDSGGLVIGETNGLSDLPIIRDNKNLPVQIKQPVVSQNFIEFIKKIQTRFIDKVGFKITYFEVNETIFQVDALTDQGWLVKFDTTRSIDDQLDVLTKLLAERKDEIHEYVDVRVEGRVYYK